MLGVHLRRVHRALEVEAQPLLHAVQAGAPREIEEQDEIEHHRRREDRVAAQEVDLHLHRVPEPPEEIDVVPAFLVVAARWVVVDAYLVNEVTVEIRVQLRLQDRVEHAQLRDLLRLERLGIVEHLAVAVAEDVRRVPAANAEHAALQARRDDGLHQRLSGLEVLARDGRSHLPRELPRRGEVDREVRRAVREGHTLLQQRPRVHLRVGDRGIALRERLLECAHARVHAVGVRVDLGRTAPHCDGAIAAALPNEGADVVAELRDHVRLRRAAFHVRAVQPLHVLGVEDAAHRLDGAQLVLHEIDVLRA